MNYQLPEALQAAMNRHALAHDPADLTREISFARALLERSADNPGLATSLLQTITRLSRELELSMVRRRELIHRDEMLQLAQHLISLFIFEFQGCPGWEDKIDRIGNQFAGHLEPPRTSR